MFSDHIARLVQHGIYSYTYSTTRSFSTSAIHADKDFENLSRNLWILSW